MEVALERPGQRLLPSQVMTELTKSLSSIVGPYIPQKIKVARVGRYQVIVHAGRPKQGRTVSKVLDQLDFTTTQTRVTQYFGGVRMEATGDTTVVNYCNISGVLIVSTTIPDVEL